MKVFVIVFGMVAALLASGGAAIPRAALAASEESPQPSPSSDAAYEQFIGTWHCKTAAGADETVVFTLNAADDLASRLSWTQDTASGSSTATFHHDPVTGAWITSNTASNGSAYAGNSEGFKGPTIIFTGTQRTSGGDVPTRESFTMFSSGDGFEHHWQTQAKKSWRDTSTAVCERA